LQQGAAAERAGVRGATQRVRVSGGYLLTGGDILTAIDGKPINTRDAMTIYLENNRRAGDAVKLTLLRDGKELTLDATLDARP
jgi:S1-C subfamily serine protease